MPSPAVAAVPVWASRLNLVGALLTWVLLVGRLVVNHWHNYGWWSYSAGEWLINYGGGFVRRGAGQLFLDVPGLSGIAALELWLVAQWTVIVVLLAVVIRRVMARTGSGWAIGAWLLPSWFIVGTLQLLWRPFGVTDLQFPTRKEQYYLMVVLVAVVWWQRRVSWPSVGVVAALLLLGVLFHEGFAPPVTVALLTVGWWATAGARPGRRVGQAVLLVLPAFVAGVAVLLNPGSAGTRVRVWDAVDPATRAWYLDGDQPPLTEGIPGAMYYLGTTARDGLHQVQSIFLANSSWVWWVINAVVVLVAVSVVVLFCDRSAGSLRRLLVPMGLILLTLLPLFAIAIDWGRWVALLANLSLVVGLAGVLMAANTRPMTADRRSVSAFVVVLLVAAVYGLPEIADVSWGFLGRP